MTFHNNILLTMRTALLARHSVSSQPRELGYIDHCIFPIVPSMIVYSYISPVRMAAERSAWICPWPIPARAWLLRCLE